MLLVLMASIERGLWQTQGSEPVAGIRVLATCDCAVLPCPLPEAAAGAWNWWEGVFVCAHLLQSLVCLLAG